MNLKDVQRLLNAEVLAGGDYLDRQVETCCGSDMMSEVLAFAKRDTLLCTGLTNLQVVRTAEMTELSALVFVRNKRPGRDILAAAEENMLPVLATACTLFEACGILYGAGIRGCRKRS